MRPWSFINWLPTPLPHRVLIVYVKVICITVGTRLNLCLQDEIHEYCIPVSKHAIFQKEKWGQALNWDSDREVTKGVSAC